MTRISIHAFYSAMIVLVATSAFVLAASDGPAPRLLPYRGHLNLDGVSVSAPLQLQFELYDDASNGTRLHNETFNVDVVAGSFAVLIGQNTALADEVLTAADLFVAISVDGTLLAGRQRITAAHRVLDHPGTFTVGTLSATTVNSVDLVSTGNVSANSLAANVVDADEIETTALVLKGSGASSPALRNIQSGSIGVCDGTNNNSQAATVTFAQPFASSPVVTLTPGEFDDNGCTSVRLRGLSTTSFQWRSYDLTGSAPCDCIHWIAIDQD